MNTSIGQSRSRHHTAAAAKVAALAALLATLPLTAANGQSPNRDDPRACTAIQDDTDRLDCYDRAFGLLEPPTAAGSIGRAERERSAESPTERSARAAPRPGVAPPADAAAAAPVAPPPPAAPAVTRVDERDPEPEAFPIVVVAMRTVGSNVTFTTDNGEVWVQTDGRRAYYPDPPFDARIRPGAMNSFFLIPDRGRSVRVRRAQ